MNKKLLYSLFGLFIGVVISFSVNASYLSSWSNDDLCGWMKSSTIPEHILAEVARRDILCYGGIEVSTLPESDSYDNDNENGTGTAFPSPDPSLIPEAIPDTNSNYSY